MVRVDGSNPRPDELLATSHLKANVHVIKPVRPRVSGRRLFVGLVVVLIGVSLASFLTNTPSEKSQARGDGSAVIEEFDGDRRIQTRSFTAKMLSGETLDTTSLRAKVVVYNVWGSWCVPCAEEAPDLVEVANQFESDVTFVGLNIRDNEAAARAFEREYKVPYDSAVADDSAQATLSFNGALSSAAVPTTLVVDRQGRVAARVIGKVTAATLRSLIAPVLAESDDSANSTR